MRLKNLFWLCLMAILFGAMNINIGTSQVTSTRLYIYPSRIPDSGLIGQQGDEYRMEVRVDKVTDLWAAGYEIHIAPYARVLVASEIAEGDFLSEHGTWPTFFTYSVNPFRGIISVGITRLPISGIPRTGASGSGTLMTFKLTVIEAGESPIDLTNDILIDSALYPINHNTFSSYYYGATAVLVRVAVLPARVVKAGENLSFWSKVRSKSGTPLWVRVRFDIVRVEDGKLISFYAGQTYFGPLPPVYLYVDEYNSWQEWDWNDPGTSLFGEPDGNYAESYTDGATTSYYSFEDVDLSGRAIADITLDGYAQYPNGADEGMDMDVYGFSSVHRYAWLGSLWGDSNWGWHGVRWISNSVLDVMSELASETELNNLRILLCNYDPASTGGPMRADSLRLKVEFAATAPAIPPTFLLLPFQELELPPAIWMTDQNDIGHYCGTATIEYSASGTMFNSGNQKTFSLTINP